MIFTLSRVHLIYMRTRVRAPIQTPRGARQRVKGRVTSRPCGDSCDATAAQPGGEITKHELDRSIVILVSERHTDYNIDFHISYGHRRFLPEHGDAGRRGMISADCVCFSMSICYRAASGPVAVFG
ncbi:hypothetical protein EVAR_18069_1 [Eumeta japonica]|uniref:Uncharacterized protein n=1 Tax=Eumeta variegata TaxID=151549 RepID=A0A4C1VHX3_EUMVA|nr:hypothetical protein EVAR_18069_1 [Eumeta japonica]